ncbi:hypothetical protein ACLQ2R_37665 [Streptosporangium sp. DT93]|uniref:hypothetical protein n=1 Tax=Streptosporangium sp. DT93 TaxID=3393428 RepID=UPI003CFB25C1
MGFMRAKTSGFDAIFGLTEDPWRAIVVREDRAARINQETMQTEDLLTNVYDNELKAIPEPFASCSDGAFEVRVNAWPKRTVFIAGNQCLYWVWGKGAEYQGPITSLPGFGEHIPADYRSDVDAIMCLPNVPYRTMLFKGNQCAIIEWGPKGRGCYYVGPLTGLAEKGWSKLPADMSGDFDHAVFLGGSAGGWYHTLLIKGDKALTMNWDSGPVKVGTYAEVAAGLGALPEQYRKPRLPAAGRFIGANGSLKLDLRVDLVGALPVVSGDIFTTENGVESYTNSFVLDGTAPLTLPATLTGTATWAETTTRPVLSVSVDKLAPGGTAKVTFTGSQEAVTCTCAYTSRFLRSIDWEIDALAGTEPPPEYPTTSEAIGAGKKKRIVTVQSAFAAAGIELRTAGTPNVVSVAGAGADLKWSVAELHAAMVSNFSLFSDTLQWKVWTFIASRAAEGSPRGLMFDYVGGAGQRQGMAVFWEELILGATRDRAREDVRTYVHELGHALNLAHSWQRHLINPPRELGPRDGYGDLSFMNYPWYYQATPPGLYDEPKYWKAFDWQFTAPELRHLRHGFFRDVAFGGVPWMTNSAETTALPDLAPPAPSRSGLRVEVSGRTAFSHGEPVVAEIKVSLDGSTPTAQAAADLSPQGENLTILVTDPAADTRPFQPVVHACGVRNNLTLDADNPAIYASAYLGYSASGFTFDQPGTYRLSARYRAPDGSTLASPDHIIEVSPPADEQDKAAGDLLTGHQQGLLLTFLGSDAPQLSDGNAALDQLITDHGDHPLAVYARMAKGTNAGRNFLTLTDGGIDVRPADTDTSIEQLSEVVATTLDENTDAGVDNITLNATMRRLARAHARGGDIKEADAVLDQLVEVFRDKHVPDPVLATITEQAEATRTELHEQP